MDLSKIKKRISIALFSILFEPKLLSAQGFIGMDSGKSPTDSLPEIYCGYCDQSAILIKIAIIFFTYLFVLIILPLTFSIIGSIKKKKSAKWNKIFNVSNAVLVFGVLAPIVVILFLWIFQK